MFTKIKVEAYEVSPSCVYSPHDAVWSDKDQLI